MFQCYIAHLSTALGSSSIHLASNCPSTPPAASSLLAPAAPGGAALQGSPRVFRLCSHSKISAIYRLQVEIFCFSFGQCRLAMPPRSIGCSNAHLQKVGFWTAHSIPNYKTSVSQIGADHGGADTAKPGGVDQELSTVGVGAHLSHLLRVHIPSTPIHRYRGQKRTRRFPTPILPGEPAVFRGPGGPWEPHLLHI
jgi:hypothetical protein